MSPINAIDGINSGFKTTDIVDAIMAFERRNAVLLEVEQQEKTDIVATLKALEAKFLALSTELSPLRSKSAFEQTSVKVSDTDKISATATGRVGAGTYEIQVLALAKNHQMASQGFDDEAAASLGTGTITLSLGDGTAKLLTIDSSNNSLVGVKQAINDAGIGITASIISDGSSLNAYRLILTGDKTGLKQKITVTSSLTGGTNLDYTNGAFDAPELLSMDSASTSQISLGPTATYTGSANKNYTFTVQGTGSQTIGTDVITIDWTDGTDSGSIVVNEADTEVVLGGSGADGLTMSFSAGDLNAGDTFQVQAFSPLIQSASDASISFGASSGGGSPITVTNDTNSFNSVISGLNINLLETTLVGTPVTITTVVDKDGIKAKINGFIDKYNEATKFISDQNKFDPETRESGVLFGDFTLRIVQDSLSRIIGATIPGISSQFNQLSAIGIRHSATGKLTIMDSTAFNKALDENLDDVIKLFTNGGTSSSNYIEFVSSDSNTVIGDNYAVDITQAATKGNYVGTVLTDPATTPLTLTSSDNRIKLTVDGLVSDEIVLDAKTYSTSKALIDEIQAKIEADSKIGTRGLAIEWITDSATTGHIEITSSTYGSTSKITLDTAISSSAYTALGLTGGTATDGKDVAGTISGEEAEGIGQILTGKEGNSTTEGLKIKVTLDPSLVVSGTEGTISLSRGVAAKMFATVDNLTKSQEGTLDRRIQGMQKQIDLIGDRVEDIDARLAIRRDSLFRQFFAMEQVLGELNAQKQFLDSQLAGINGNWKVGSS